MFSFLARAADCSRLRLAAACGIIKIAQEAHCIEYITLEIFQQLSLVMQVIDYELSIYTSPIIHLVCTLLPLPQILHKHCLFSLLGPLKYPGEITNIGYAKIWGANMVYYGRCARGE